MRAIDRVRDLAVLGALACLACAGAGTPSRTSYEPLSHPDAISAEAVSFQDLLSRLDILIASVDDGGTSRVRVSEARALRLEAMTLLANGDEILACDLLRAAIALFEEGAE